MSRSPTRSRCLGLYFVGAVAACTEPQPQPVPRRTVAIAIVADVSASSAIPTGQTIADLRCPQVIATIQDALTAPGLRQLDVLILATGSKATSYEARVIIPWRSFAPASRLFGKRVSLTDQRQAFLRDLDALCRLNLRPETSSPIFFSIERAALSLSDRGRELPRGPEIQVSRSLVTLTDGRENAHPGIRSSLLAVSEALRQGKSIPKRPPTVPILNLDGVTVRLCGLAEHTHTGSRDDLAVSPAALPITWRSILGDATAFDAACPSTALPLSSTKGGAR